MRFFQQLQSFIATYRPSIFVMQGDWQRGVREIHTPWLASLNIKYRRLIAWFFWLFWIQSPMNSNVLQRRYTCSECPTHHKWNGAFFINWIILTGSLCVSFHIKTAWTLRSTFALKARSNLCALDKHMKIFATARGIRNKIFSSIYTDINSATAFYLV
jgi:hypothetical protein